MTTIWVFHGINGRFASGVFDTLQLAETWISQHKLTGVLTAYPLNTGAYDWAVTNQFFTPTKEVHATAEFIGRFSAATQEHFHYADGSRDG
jgi:hypothetical protein